MLITVQGGQKSILKATKPTLFCPLLL